MPFGVHKPSECVMIGDHIELDIDGAKKCGINTIWVNSKKIVQNNKKPEFIGLLGSKYFFIILVKTMKFYGFENFISPLLYFLV